MDVSTADNSVDQLGTGTQSEIITGTNTTKNVWDNYNFPSAAMPIKKRHLRYSSSSETANDISTNEAKIIKIEPVFSGSKDFSIDSILSRSSGNTDLSSKVSENQTSEEEDYLLFKRAPDKTSLENSANTPTSSGLEKTLTRESFNNMPLSNNEITDEKLTDNLLPAVKKESVEPSSVLEVNREDLVTEDRSASSKVVSLENISNPSSPVKENDKFEKGLSALPSSPVEVLTSDDTVSLSSYSNSDNDSLSDSLPILETNKKTYSLTLKPQKAFPGSVKKSSDFIDLTEDDEPEPFPVARTFVRNSKVIDLTSEDDDEDAAIVDITAPSETKHLQVCPIVADFVLRNFATIGGVNVMPSAIRCEKAFGGFKITGSRTDIAKAEKILKSIKWFSEEISYCCPELATHFQSDAWTDFKKVLENEIRCQVAIQIQRNDKSNSSQAEQNSSSTSSNRTNADQSYRESDVSEAGFLNTLLNDEIPEVIPKMSPVTPQSTSTDIPLLLDESAKSTMYGAIKVVVCKGDITNDCSAAIVNGVVPSFDLSVGAISPAIVLKGGPHIVTECAFQKNSNQSSLVRVTGGHNLLCKHVIHLVAPGTLEQYVPRISLALRTANDMRLPSIAIPSIGTGGINLNPVMVAQNMARAFEDFARYHDGPLKIIKVVIYEEAQLQTFVSHIITIKEVQRYGFNKVLSLEAQNKSMAMNDYIVVCVKSDRSISAVQAKDRILAHMKKHVCQRKVEDKIVAKLGDHDCIDIYEASIKHNVKVEYNQGILLLGITDRVAEMNEFIRELWCELREAETLSKITSWRWEVGPQNFVMLPLRVSRAIEQCYEQNKSGEHSVRLFGDTVHINFAMMTYRYHDNIGRIQRSGADNAPLALPHEWYDMMGKAMMRVALSPVSAEYQRVISLFFQSHPKIHDIEKVERVQNIALYRQYEVMRNHVTKALISNNLVERDLFHGTNEEDASKICAHGFDRGFAGKNGISQFEFLGNDNAVILLPASAKKSVSELVTATAFGRGSYFAVRSSYSVSYAKRGRGKRGYMFLAKVLTGDYVQGCAEMRSPPEKWSNGEERHLYDSVVDNLNCPDIFVVFKDSSVYPSYLITFT